MTFQLGPLAVRIDGAHPVTRWAARTYDLLRTDQSPNLSFRFVPKLPIPNGVGDSRCRIGNEQIWFRLRRYDFSIRQAAHAQWDLAQRDQRPTWLRSLADLEETWKMWLSHGRSIDTHLLKDFAYTISPLAFQCALLEHQSALIHASGFCVGNSAVLMPAWGGTGKSTVVCQAVLHGEAQFLADDHAVIDASGYLHLHLLPIHAYRYHAQSDPVLAKQLLAACDPVNRKQWRVATTVRPKRAVRWVNPADLFGHDRLARQAKIKNVIVMFRGDTDDFVWEPTSAHECARPCTAIIMQEISGFAERLALASAGWDKPILPSLDEAWRAVHKTYEAAFAHADCARLLIPRGADSQALIKFLRRYCPLIKQAIPNEA